jgi:hypothetical protein
LATTLAVPRSPWLAEQTRSRSDTRYALGLVTILSLLAPVIHGYHPYAEDGGLYLAGVKYLLNPRLYPHETAFVVEHLRFSLFAPTIAMLVRISGLKLETMMFLLYLIGFWLTLLSAWALTAQCYRGRGARTGAVCLLAAWLTLPIAGTSLMLMDPYVTARTFSTPCALAALCGALVFLNNDTQHQRRLGIATAVLCLLTGALLHPLMSAYAFSFVFAIFAATLSQRLGIIPLLGVCITAIGMAAILHAFSPPATTLYSRVALTRTYWFLSQWHWYEVLGLLAPLTILILISIYRKETPSLNALSKASVSIGAASIAVSLLYARTETPINLVASLQPLRTFQLIYIVMILFLGAELADRYLHRNLRRWFVTFSALSAIMFLAQRNIFPTSSHIEFPAQTGTTERNPWSRAFLWIRTHTPNDALFAMDADYIEKQGEDTQSFRAIAERSALPDYSKDGGEASITPSLTNDWITGQKVQAGMSTQTDETRRRVLIPLGVSWIILERNAVTALPCDYTNEAVKVCELQGKLNAKFVSPNSPPSYQARQ